MALPLPALRRPKIVLSKENSHQSLPHAKEYVIIAMKGEKEKKLVVTKDSYNGILSTGGFYKCVFCETLLDLKQAAKDSHVLSANHGKTMAKYPHADEFSHNLIRNLTDNICYCTICNVIVKNVMLMKHIHSKVHLQELDQADARALTHKGYK